MDNFDKGHQMPHPSLTITAHGRPTLVKGIANSAVNLTGHAQYLNLGDHSNKCLGNLLHCTNGLTVSMWARFRAFTPKAHYLSTGVNGVNMFFREGQMKVTAEIPTQQWEVSLPPLTIDEWNLLEISWDPAKGLSVYINTDLAGNDTVARKVKQGQTLQRSGHVYLGRANEGLLVNNGAIYGEVVIDDFEVWTSRRAELIAFNYINRGRFKDKHIPKNLHSHTS